MHVKQSKISFSQHMNDMQKIKHANQDEQSTWAKTYEFLIAKPTSNAKNTMNN